jgi:hypothetical protein
MAPLATRRESLVLQCRAQLATRYFKLGCVLEYSKLEFLESATVVLVRAARACSVCRVVFSRPKRREIRYDYLKRALVSFHVSAELVRGKSVKWA